MKNFTKTKDNSKFSNKIPIYQSVLWILPNHAANFLNKKTVNKKQD